MNYDFNLYSSQREGVSLEATFVFDEESNMIKEFRNVKPAGHAQEVLDYLKSLE